MSREGTIPADQVIPAAEGSTPSEIDIKIKAMEEKYEQRLRGLQGAKDKLIAGLESQVSSMAAERERLQDERLAMISDPTVKANMQIEHLQAKLKDYEQKQTQQQEIINARNWFSDLGVPRELLNAVTTTDEMQQVTKTYFASRPTVAQEANVVTEEVEGADDVVIGTGPSPASNPAPNADYLKELAELKDDKSLKSRDRSLRALELERKYREKRGTRPRPTV